MLICSYALEFGWLSVQNGLKGFIHFTIVMLLSLATILIITTYHGSPMVT